VSLQLGAYNTGRTYKQKTTTKPKPKTTKTRQRTVGAIFFPQSQKK
jgi:hypothetical protein